MKIKCNSETCAIRNIAQCEITTGVDFDPSIIPCILPESVIDEKPVWVKQEGEED